MDMPSNLRNNPQITTITIRSKPDVNCKTLKKNIVAKYLQSVLKPLNMMEAIFFSAKYKIEEDFIIQNCWKYDVISAFGTAIYISGCFYLLFASSFDIIGEKRCDFVYYGNINAVVVFSIGSILNYVTNVTQKTNNVLLISGIQNVQTFLKMNGMVFKSCIVFNWVYVIALNSFHIIWIFYYCSIFPDLCFVDTFTSYFLICFDINILYAALIVKLKRKTVWMLIENVKESRCIEDEKYWKNYFKTYTEIFKSYQLVETIFENLILFYNLYIFSNALVDVAIHIQMKKITIDSQANFVFEVLTSQLWQPKSIILLTSLSLECERFYLAMSNVQLTCSKLATSGNVSETQKRVYKNMQRLQRASFKKMNVCGLFVIDATTPFHFFSLITTYTVVLLQFSL